MSHHQHRGYKSGTAWVASRTITVKIGCHLIAAELTEIQEGGGGIKEVVTDTKVRAAGTTADKELKLGNPRRLSVTPALLA